MAYLPWRFQADIKPGDDDPSVTVFFGPERSVMDENGEPTAEVFIEQSTADPVVMPLSQVVTGLANPTKMESARVESRKQRTTQAA